MAKRFLYLFCAIVLCLAPVAIHAQDVTFFTNLNDVPVMADLAELPNEGFVFDKPEGRVIEAIAVGTHDVSDQDIISYYTQTLPQFGWNPTSTNSFIRGKERLELAISQDETAVHVHFILSPL